jgi:hypothetical protein
MQKISTITNIMTTDQQTAHADITRSIEQCEVWTMGDPDTEIAKGHLLDALDEMNYQLMQLEL